MASPAQLDLQQRSLNIDGFSTLEDRNFGDVVVPVDGKDDVEAALLETFLWADVSVIEDPRLCTKRQS